MADTNKLTKGLAVVGGVAIIGYAITEAVRKIIANVEIVPGTIALDYNTNPVNPITNEVYVRLDLPVSITNGNSFPLGVKWFKGVVKYGSLTLSEVYLPYGVWAPAYGTDIISIDVDIPIKRVLDDIQALIANGNILNALLNKITLSGQFQVYGNATNISIPINDLAIPITS